jgi:L-asparaginase
VTVRVLGTGGTIAAYLEDDRLRLLSMKELVETLPDSLPVIDAVDLTSLPSSALLPLDMLAIAREVRSSLLAGADGVVVTHGTDTLEETAFMTDLLLGADSRQGGVVFTGAMRFASDPEPDGPRNLADAIRLAASPVAREQGVLVSFAGEVHRARTVTKVDTSVLQPFASGSGPLGHSDQAAPEVWVEAAPRWTASNGIVSHVALVKAYPGMSGVGVEALLADGIEGLVVEGFGVFNVPGTLTAAIGKAIDQGVAVVVASRAHTSGGLDQGPVGHRQLHDLGAIGSYGLSANKAWVALMVGLSRTNGSGEELREWFRTITRD